MRPIPLALIPLALCACATTPARTAELPAQRVLREGERAQANDLLVRFDAVENDSRCPPRVQCIREGEAIVALGVSTSAAAVQPVRIQVSSRDSARANYGAYRIQVDSLSPRPAAPERYRVWLTLSRRD
jgi:hypothetical protein